MIRLILDLMRFNLLNWFYEIWDLFDFEIIAFMLWDFLNVVGILYKHIRFYKFHQIPLLCDRQELACTPKDPPRRVDMNEISLICFYNKNHWVINKNVWKPALWDLLENRICALISWYICSYILNFFADVHVRVTALNAVLARDPPR